MNSGAGYMIEVGVVQRVKGEPNTSTCAQRAVYMHFHSVGHVAVVRFDAPNSYLYLPTQYNKVVQAKGRAQRLSTNPVTSNKTTLHVG